MLLPSSNMLLNHDSSASENELFSLNFANSSPSHTKRKDVTKDLFLSRVFYVPKNIQYKRILQHSFHISTFRMTFVTVRPRTYLYGNPPEITRRLGIETGDGPLMSEEVARGPAPLVAPRNIPRGIRS